MSNPNVKPSDRFQLMGVVDPDAYAAGSAYSTGWVNAGLFESLMAVVAVGDFVATGKVDAKLEQATTDGGTPKDVTGKAITQLTQAGTDDNKQAIINCQSEDLDVANGYDWVRLTLTVTTAGADLTGFLFGVDARYPPATDATTVDEIVG